MDLNYLTIEATRTASVRTSVLVTVIVLLLASSSNVSGEATKVPAHELGLIAQKVKDGAVTRIEIFALPKAMETRVGLTPERLKSYPGVAIVTVRDLDRVRQTLLEALRHTKAVPLKNGYDVRRGIIFYTQDATPLSVYFDQFDQGEVNGIKAKFSGALLQWIESYVPADHR